MKTKNLIKVVMLSLVIGFSSCKKDSPTPSGNDDNNNLDCNGIENGTSILDDCGDCQQAYIYDYVTHAVTLLDDTNGIVLGATEMLVMPSDPGNPYWNSGCITAPTSYVFMHNGQNTVTYSGQTARLNMAAEILDMLADASSTDASVIMNMIDNGTGFSDPSLDASGKNIGGKTAYYQSAVVRDDVKSRFAAMVTDFTTNVAPAMANGTQAAPGVPGMVENRELNAKGQEIDQLFAKGMIGALCLDQVVNGYLSEAKIGDGVDNTNRDPNEDNGATAMEHHFDEAYGYVYGMVAENSTGDLSTDNLLGKYLNKYDGYKQIVWDAFLLGRAAITGNDSQIRDAQAQIIKENLSKVIAERAIYYLNDAALHVDQSAAYFHSLSEGYGFIMSLQFTYTANGAPYFTNAEVNSMLDQLEAGNGFWDRTDAELYQMALDIATVAGL